MNFQRLVTACATVLLIPAYFISAQVIREQTPLNAGQEGTIIVAKLQDGDSLFIKLAQIAKEYSIQSGLILFNVGQLRDFSIGQYNPVSKRYISKTYNRPFELVSMQGTFSTGIDDAGLIIDCQATLADSSNYAIAGHLTKGIVSINNKITILKMNELSFVSRYDVATGLFELNVSK